MYPVGGENLRGSGESLGADAELVRGHVSRERTTAEVLEAAAAPENAQGNVHYDAYIVEFAVRGYIVHIRLEDGTYARHWSSRSRCVNDVSGHWGYRRPGWN